MNKVPLRLYHKEIEDAIDKRQIEEAIAHCLHILNIFPKHIDTYRLLGKAYLEIMRYSNAADIFQRVLSSIPDDFISHVGMSVIREDEGNLDASIWHMERAFESQPYNTAIQGELRRLYGLRDGMEPPKIRMTRGALARMYAKSELYDQAIAEVRSNLSEDPQRADLRILLARMYARSGNQNNAIEIFSLLIQRFPYCLEANRYLANIFSDSERSDEAEVYRLRLETLDPYETHTSSHFPKSENVPDQAVSIPKLDWDGTPVSSEIPEQPEWAKSIGIDPDEFNHADQDLPDWLSTSQSISRDDDQSGDIQDDYIPKWMQQAGWRPDSGEFDENQESFTSDSNSQEAVPGSIPEWLQGMAPDEDPGSSESDYIDPDLPEWLSEEADGASDTIVNWLEEKDSEADLETEEMTDVTQDHSPKITLEHPEGKTYSLGDELDVIRIPDTPDWIQELGDDIIDSSSLQSEDERVSDQVETTDWIEGDPEETPDTELANTVSGEGDTTSEPEDTDEIPYWLEGLSDKTSGTHQVDKEPMGKGLHDDQQESDEIPYWLKGLIDEIPEEEPVGDVPMEPKSKQDQEETDEVLVWLQEMSVEDLENEKAEDYFSEQVRTDEQEVNPEWVSELPDDTTGALPVENQLEEETTSEEREETDVALILSKPDSEKDPETREADAHPIGIAQTEEKATPEDIPDWLKDLMDDVITTNTIEPNFEDKDVADSLQDMPEPLDSTPELTGEVADRDMDEVFPIEQGAIDYQEELDEVLDLSGATSEQAPEQVNDKALKMESEDIGEQEETVIPDKLEESPSWLQDLTDKAQEEEIVEILSMEQDEQDVTIDQKEAEEIPEWLRDFTKEVLEGEGDDSHPQENVFVETQGESGETEDLFESVESITLEDLEDNEPVEIPDWLQDLEQGKTIPSIPSGVTGWLNNLDEEELDEMEIEYEPGELPAWLEEMLNNREPTELSNEDEKQPVTYPAPNLEEEKDIESVQSGSVMESDERIIGDSGADSEFVDVEASMEWLEGLASEDEVTDSALLSTPERRIETQPSFIDSEKEQRTLPSEQEALEQISEFNLDSTEDDVVPPKIPTTPIPDIDPTEQGQTDFDFDDAESAMAWLEGLAAKQGVSEEELITKPEERPDFPPEWVYRDTEHVSDSSGVQAEIQAESSDKIEETIGDMKTQDEAPDVGDEKVDDQWLPTDQQEYILDINKASLNQFERLPSLGFEKAQAIITYRDEFGPFDKIQDLLQIEGIDPEILDSLESFLTVSEPLQPELLLDEEIDFLESTEEPYQSVLQSAQNELRENNLINALDKFSGLIRDGLILDQIFEVISLETDSGAIPLDNSLELFQSLGDASFEVDDLQLALDAYTKAEELVGRR